MSSNPYYFDSLTGRLVRANETDEARSPIKRTFKGRGLFYLGLWDKRQENLGQLRKKVIEVRLKNAPAIFNANVNAGQTTVIQLAWVILGENQGYKLMTDGEGYYIVYGNVAVII